MATLQANFAFTIPTPSGTTTDSGTVNGGQINGGSRLGSLSIVWPGQPIEFDFNDGTKLSVALGGLIASCTGNGCLDAGGPYYMSATFLVLNGPTDTGSANAPTTTPLPAALPLFAGGAGLIAFLARRRKRKAA